MALDNPTIGEIAMFAGNFPPRGWAFCNGQLLSIADNQALFSIIGTIYGGDGRSTVGLPDLRGRAPIHSGDGSQGPGLSPRRLGVRGGEENHTLVLQEMPSHNHLTTNTAATDQHVLLSTSAAVNEVPSEGDLPAVANFPPSSGLANTNVKSFGPHIAGSTVNGQTLSGNAGLTVLNNGGSRSHNNMQPFLAINYIIALTGTYPSRS